MKHQKVIAENRRDILVVSCKGFRKILWLRDNNALGNVAFKGRVAIRSKLTTNAFRELRDLVIFKTDILLGFVIVSIL